MSDSVIQIPFGASGDGRFATNCPHREVNNRNHAYADLPRSQPSPLQQLLMDKGFEHEVEVFERLQSAHGIVRLPQMDSSGLIDETATQMRKGMRLILGGALPVVSGRAGKPDILVRVDQPSRKASWGYVPVDVKSHAGFDGEAKPVSWLIGDIDSPFLEVAVESEMSGKPALNDSLQLAHYWEMLQEHGWSAAVDPIGGIFDIDFRLTWRRLDLEMWRYEHPVTGETVARSALEILGIEWSFRWEAINCMLSGQSALTEPILHGDCATCLWKHVCYDELTRDEHVSLIAGVTMAHVKKLGQIGVRKQSELAALDIRTSLIVDRAHVSKVDLAKCVISAHEHSAPSESVRVVTGKSKKAYEFLISEGLLTLGDLLNLDRKIASMKPFSNITLRIDSARVRLDPDGLPYFSRSQDFVPIPRGDIEIDVDMENSEHVYLWGTNTTVRNAKSSSKLASDGYRPFHTMAGGYENEGLAFVAFWSWIHNIIDESWETGWTIRFYCYTKVEQHKMLEIARRWFDLTGMPTTDEIDSFCSSEHWVDLKVNVDSLIWPTDSLGLKKIAPLSGFEWRAEDAGGDNSIMWYESATRSSDEAVRQEMSAKLIEYNEDDVLATKAIRNWMDDGMNGRGPAFRHVTELDPLYLS